MTWISGREEGMFLKNENVFTCLNMPLKVLIIRLAPFFEDLLVIFEYFPHKPMNSINVANTWNRLHPKDSACFPCRVRSCGLSVMVIFLIKIGEFITQLVVSVILMSVMFPSVKASSSAKCLTVPRAIPFPKMEENWTIPVKIEYKIELSTLLSLETTETKLVAELHATPVAKPRATAAG